MARLNEPAAPVESLESRKQLSHFSLSQANDTLNSVKRRFVRQNRDLARHNSQQSLKIRMLESELARLRAENVVICEENIQLHTQLDDLQRGRDVSVSVTDYAEHEAIQNELEARVKEFGALVHRLGHANTRIGTGGERKRRRKSEILAATNVERLSPGARRLQRALDRGEASAMKQAEIDEDSRMPAIFEDANHPRRTLEMGDLQRLLVEANNSESPDFGPPPKTFFDREHSGDEALQSDGLASVNLERRRRRSTISKLPETTTDQDEVPDEVSDDKMTLTESDTEHLLRVGAKRKWDARNQKTSASTASHEEVALGLNSGNGEQMNTMPTAKRSSATPEAATASVAPGRKVLAPKPVNNDPVVSPRKVTVGSSKAKPAKAVKPVLSAEPKASAPTRPSARGRATRDSKALSIPRDEPQVDVIETVDIKLEPKTPGLVLDEIFSPSDSRILDESACPDTPPPMTTSAGGIEGPTGLRGTRRARAQVSYAEPSLNTKMRRAGDKMDAVAGSGRQSLTGDGRSRSTSVQLDVLSSQKEKAPTSLIKTTSASQDGSEVTKEDRLKFDADVVALNSTSESLSARLDALVKAESREGDIMPRNSTLPSTTATRKRQSRRPSELAAEIRTLDATDVFDVTDSPSSTHSGGAVSAPVLTLSGSATASTLSRPTNRRQTLAGNLGSANITTLSRPGSSGSDGATGPSKATATRKVAGALGPKTSKEATLSSRESEVVSRAERIAARRRSMML